MKNKQKNNYMLKASGIICIPTVMLCLIFSLFIILHSGCSKNPAAPGSRGECEACTKDVDCKPGMTCEIFTGKGYSGGTMAYQRCATPTTYTCN